MKEKKLTTLTVRIAEEEEREAIRYVMGESGCGRAAQAMIFACKAYRTMGLRNKTFVSEIREKNLENTKRLQNIIKTLTEENERLRKKLKSLQEGIAGLHDLSEKS